MESPEEMYQANVYIGDLALHDSNREYILAGTQQHPELSLALNQVRHLFTIIILLPSSSSPDHFTGTDTFQAAGGQH